MATNSGPTIEVVETKLFAGAVADELIALISEAVDSRGKVSIALSGGSTPGAVYRLLGLPPRVSQVPWEKVSLFWGDERWVGHDDTQSNYRMVKENLLDNIKGKGPKVVPVDTSLPTPEKGASAYDDALRRELPDGFDIILLGMGEDGHTASLFPHSEALSVKGKQCVAAPHPTGSVRITLTPEALTAGKKILFIVTGENKAAMVKEVLHGHAPIADCPAKLLGSVKEKVTWFLDSGAAKQIE